MNFDLSDEQKMLADHARALFSDRSSFDRLRTLIDDGADWDEPLWREMSKLGFLGACIPSEYGGSGLTRLDMAMISQEIGRANAAIPFFSSIVLAADAIDLAGSPDQKQAFLPGMASGEIIACYAHTNGFGESMPPAQRLTWDAGKLCGVKAPVADAGVADVAIVQALQNGAPVLALVWLDQSGVSKTRLSSFDHLRPHYRLEFDGVEAELLCAVPASDAAGKIMVRGAVQAAFEGVGGAEACLYMARDYALERRIFARPLASYQAIKHKLADLLTKIELARSSAYHAAWTALEDEDSLDRAAAAARLLAIDAFEHAARENLQVHGGIGYTFEANCHFFYRRERTLALSLGGRSCWADRMVATIPGTMHPAQGN